MIFLNVLDSEDKILEIQNTNLLVDYVFLDTEERKKFAQDNHTYLIEQVQMNDVKSISQNHYDSKIQINLNYPCKELFWALPQNTYLKPNSQTGNNYFNYSRNTGHSFENMTILLNGLERFSPQKAEYFQNYVQYFLNN